jgi:acetylornithine deacetylase/succinyl-diaminopimelate desuccinylase-like protein
VLSNVVETVTGRPSIHQGITGVTDLAWLAGAGVPGAIFGPGSMGNAHGDDEHIVIDELTAGVFAFALAICEWCGVA